MSPCYPSSIEVPEEQRTRLRSIIDSYFDLQSDRLSDEYRTVCLAVDRLDKLVELRETQQTQVASSGTSLDELAIVKEVLGERRGHIRGVGRVLKGHLFLTRFDRCIEGPTKELSISSL
ncbi:Uncharacterized protein Adt_22409 [Abeliophyllum distichum]|uniref:Uncharacterized protein n=1 Tax=Abeliophyllum distichum TaxID=126358 RepID=A0ABD1T279_9LAMI